MPLILSIIFLLIPRLYLSQEYEPWTRADPDAPPEWDFFKYFFKILPQTPNKLSWLWFLLVLFLVFVINYPITVWTQRRARQEPLSVKDDGKIVLLGAMTMATWSGICLALAEEKDVPFLIGSIKVLSSYLVFIGMI